MAVTSHRYFTRTLINQLRLGLLHHECERVKNFLRGEITVPVTIYRHDSEKRASAFLGYKVLIDFLMRKGHRRIQCVMEGHQRDAQNSCRLIETVSTSARPPISLNPLHSSIQRCIV